MKVVVTITRRPEIADPEGTTIARALRRLGFDEVVGVRADKRMTLEFEGDDPESAAKRADEMCRRLLANPVIEDYRVEVVAVDPAPGGD